MQQGLSRFIPRIQTVFPAAQYGEINRLARQPIMLARYLADSNELTMDEARELIVLRVLSHHDAIAKAA